MEKNSTNNFPKQHDKSLFPLCFLTGLLGFFIAWQSNVDYSGVRGFFIGFLVPFTIYVFAALLERRKEMGIKKSIQIEGDEVMIKETNAGNSLYQR